MFFVGGGGGDTGYRTGWWAGGCVDRTVLFRPFFVRPFFVARGFVRPHPENTRKFGIKILARRARILIPNFRRHILRLIAAQGIDTRI